MPVLKESGTNGGCTGPIQVKINKIVQNRTKSYSERTFTQTSLTQTGRTSPVTFSTAHKVNMFLWRLLERCCFVSCFKCH